MPLVSAGILLYRRAPHGVQVLLVRPGGPYWRGRDHGAWMIPKGQVGQGEDLAACALREFEEELGTRPAGVPEPLCRIRQAGGKWVEAFALEGDLDAAAIVGNEFTLDYPPGSGAFRAFPEVEEARWLTLAEARSRILPSQSPILDALEARLAIVPPPGNERPP